MIKSISLIILLSSFVNAKASERYEVPLDIKELVAQVNVNFQKLQSSMLRRYVFLKHKSTLSEAEFEELCAYDQIFFRTINLCFLPLTKRNLPL